MGTTALKVRVGTGLGEANFVRAPDPGSSLESAGELWKPPGSDSLGLGWTRVWM